MTGYFILFNSQLLNCPMSGCETYACHTVNDIYATMHAAVLIRQTGVGEILRIQAGRQRTNFGSVCRAITLVCRGDLHTCLTGNLNPCRRSPVLLHFIYYRDWFFLLGWSHTACLNVQRACMHTEHDKLYLHWSSY